MILISENADQVQTQNGTICRMCKQLCIGVNIHGLPMSLLKAHTTSHLHLMLPIGGSFWVNLSNRATVWKTSALDVVPVIQIKDYPLVNLRKEL